MQEKDKCDQCGSEDIEILPFNEAAVVDPRDPRSKDIIKNTMAPAKQCRSCGSPQS